MPGESSATYDLLLHENELVNPLSQSPATARRLINFIPSKSGELTRKPYAPFFTSVNPLDGYWFSFVRDFLFYVGGTPTRQTIIGVSNNSATFLYKFVSGGTITALPNAAFSPPHNAAAGWAGDPLILYSDGLLYISDGHASDKGTVYDGTNTWKWGLEVPAVPVLFSLTAAGGIGTPSFAGAGLNDLTTGGTFTGGADATFEIEITATGTPDTFRWRVNGGAWNSGVLITGEAQSLSRGLTITFASTTGHTATDTWTIVCAGLYIEEFVEYALTEYDTTYKRESAPGTRLRVAPEQAGYYKVHLSLPARVNKAPGTAADWTAGYANKFRVYRSHIDGSTQLFRLSEVNATDSAQSDAITDSAAFYGDETSTLLAIEPPFRNQKPRPSKVGVKCHGRFALRDEARRSRLWITGFHEILAQQSFSPPLETVPGTTNQALVESANERQMFNLSDFENFVELANEQFEIRSLLFDRDAVMIGTERDVVAMFGRRPEDPFEVSNVATYEFGTFHKNSFLRTTHGLVVFTADRRLVLDPAFGAGGERTSQVEDIGWPKQLELDKTDIQFSNRFQMVHYKFGQDIDQLWISYTTQNAIDGGRAHLLCYDFQVRGWISVDDVLATCIGIVQEDQGFQFLVAGGSVAGGTGASGEDRKLRVVMGYDASGTSAYQAAATRIGLPAPGTETRPANTWITSLLDLQKPEAWKVWQWVSFYRKVGTPAIAVRFYSDPQDIDSLDQGTVAVPRFNGTGLDDATSGGTYSGSLKAEFRVEILTAATPDTFRWRKDNGNWSAPVAITGGAQALSDSVTVTFAATTGHTVGDFWIIDIPNLPAEVLVFRELSSREFQGWISAHQQCKRAVLKFTIASGGAAGAMRGIKVNVTPGGDLDRL